MLVLAEPGVTDEFSDHFGSDVLAVFDDPYEALAAMEHQDWAGVVIAASYAGLTGLCCAVRRLQQDARVVVLCGPATESEVRGLIDGIAAGSAIDDYFIYPLTDDEWRKVAPADQRDDGAQAPDK
jgi:hypothetical protein